MNCEKEAADGGKADEDVGREDAAGKVDVAVDGDAAEPVTNTDSLCRT